jgi:hypothetical protein
MKQTRLLIAVRRDWVLFKIYSLFVCPSLLLPSPPLEHQESVNFFMAWTSQVFCSFYDSLGASDNA